MQDGARCSPCAEESKPEARTGRALAPATKLVARCLEDRSERSEHRPITLHGDEPYKSGKGKA